MFPKIQKILKTINRHQIENFSKSAGKIQNQEAKSRINKPIQQFDLKLQKTRTFVYCKSDTFFGGHAISRFVEGPSETSQTFEWDYLYCVSFFQLT